MGLEYLIVQNRLNKWWHLLSWLVVYSAVLDVNWVLVYFVKENFFVSLSIDFLLSHNDVDAFTSEDYLIKDTWKLDLLCKSNYLLIFDH
jgi:hypothetical protein